jgi:hypothetical protein
VKKKLSKPINSDGRLEREGKQSPREQLKAGYRANAERDLAMAAEWFPLEEEAWRRSKLPETRNAMKRKSQPIDDDDRLTPDQERGLAYGIAQGDAGLTYGPFETKGLSLQTFLNRSKRTRRASIRIPAVLFTYLKQEAKRFGMTGEELMVAILETHQFKNQDRQLILLTLDRAFTKRPGARSRNTKPPVKK